MVSRIEFSQGCKSAALHQHERTCGEITLCRKWEITWQWDLFTWSVGWMKSHKFIKMHSCYDRRHRRSDNQREENGSQAAGTFVKSSNNPTLLDERLVMMSIWRLQNLFRNVSRLWSSSPASHMILYPRVQVHHSASVLEGIMSNIQTNLYGYPQFVYIRGIFETLLQSVPVNSLQTIKWHSIM